MAHQERKAPGRAALELARRNGATHICVSAGNRENCWKSFVGRPSRCDECGGTEFIEVNFALDALDVSKLERTAAP